MRYSCYANYFQFDSHLANFRFFCPYFVSGLRVKVRFRVYLPPLVRFYQAYCTFVMRYCYVTGGV